jgi:hypothetical protein
MAEHGAELIVLTPAASVPLPALIAGAGKRAARRFVEFFTANIQNQNTREAYARAINTLALIGFRGGEVGMGSDSALLV